MSPELFPHETERVEYKTRTCTSSLWLWTSVVQSADHRKLILQTGSTLPLYCIVFDDVNKQIGFHGNVPPSQPRCTN